MPDDIAVRQLMDGRVAHFKSLTKSPQAFVDTRLPDHDTGSEDLQDTDLETSCGHDAAPVRLGNPFIVTARPGGLPWEDSQPRRGIYLDLLPWPYIRV